MQQGIEGELRARGQIVAVAAPGHWLSADDSPQVVQSLGIQAYAHGRLFLHGAEEVVPELVAEDGLRLFCEVLG